MSSYNLVCTGCGNIFIENLQIDDKMKEYIKAGYCNRCPEEAKLEWRIVK